MTGILDHIRNTTVADLDNVTGDFSDLVPRMPVSRRTAGDPVRIVKGADDLRHPLAGRPSTGVYAPASTPAASVTTDGRSPRQIDLMDSLLKQLGELDTDTAQQAVDYTTRMTDAGRWTPGREGNASAWISRMIAKVRELKARPVAAAPTNNAWAEWRTLAAALVRVGGQHGARFAVATEKGAVNELAFWWIVKHDGPQGTRYFLRQVIGGQGATRVRMSPEAMISIAKKIQAAGPVEAMLKYGQEIGECGHCGRTLTNDESRAFGMGPKCRKGKAF